MEIGALMDGYSSPQLTELGSVADFTRADNLAANYDGMMFRDGNVASTQPVIGYTPSS